MVALRWANAGASANTKRATDETEIRFIEISCIVADLQVHIVCKALES